MTPDRALAPGQRLGPYEIGNLIGMGGMGEVYEARDTRLDRSVAVKVLPRALTGNPDALARFRREMKAIAALSHDNILAIHDVGVDGSTPYAVMELLEGESLRHRLARGRIPWPRSLEIAIAVVDGVTAAHEKGIVHRDLKPENIFLASDGRVKVLDFGLAYVRDPPDADALEGSPTREMVTQPGMVVGTVGYMSPEQLRGERGDARSDIFALGCVLQELATGVAPFRRPTQSETIAAVLKDDPPPADTAGFPPAVAQAIRWCLAKEPSQRVVSARELGAILRASVQESRRTTARPRWALPAALVLLAALAVAGLWTAFRGDRGAQRGEPAAAPRTAQSIVVLPFDNLGGQAADEHIADGMTEALITGLATAPGLRVISRHATVQLKGRPIDVRALGKEMRVAHALTGSVQRSGERLRVSAQLVDTASGSQLWAEKLDRPAADIFALQDEITSRVTDALRLHLAPEAARRGPGTRNLEAYDAYLRGQQRFQTARRSGVREVDTDLAAAIGLLERAVELDPEFATGHAALGEAWAERYFSVAANPQWLEKARASVERAIALDPRSAAGYLARSRLRWTRASGFDHDAAIEDARRAIAADPSLVEAREMLARIYQHVGLLEEAARELDAAEPFAPGDALLVGRRVRVNLSRLRFAEALSDYERLPEKNREPQIVPEALLALGRLDEAWTVLESRLAEHPGHDMLNALKALALALGGHREKADAAIARTSGMDSGLGHFHHSAYALGAAQAALGRRAEAVAWLRRAAEHGYPCYPQYTADPMLASLRNDPGFQALLAEMREKWDKRRQAALRPAPPRP